MNDSTWTTSRAEEGAGSAGDVHPNPAMGENPTGAGDCARPVAGGVGPPDAARIRAGTGPTPTVAFLAIGLTTFLWGVNYTIAKMAVAEIHPLAVALARVLVATPIFFFALARHAGGRRLRAEELRLALPLGLTGVFANQIFFITGIRRTTPAHSSLMVALLPIVVLILAAILLGERLRPLKVTGVIVALGGIVIISLRGSGGGNGPTLTGDLLTLGGVCAFAYYTVAGKRVIPRLGVLRSTALSFLIGGALMIPLTLPAALGQDWSSISPRAWLALAYVVLFSTVLCYFLYYWALSGIESGKVAAFTYLQPVIAGTVSHLLLGETIQGHFLLGGAAVLLGVFLAEKG
jgi:drug/metabolite transporter (DMT)-like permease